MPTLEQLYRNVNSTLSANDIWKEKIYHNDTVKALNDAIADQRIEYINRGLGFEFATTETFYVTMEDIQYPFVRNAFQLSRPLLRSLPIHQTILVNSFPKSDIVLDDEEVSLIKGDEVIKGKRLYKVVEDVDNENVYDKTFEAEYVRFFYAGMKVRLEDIILFEDSYYRPTQAGKIEDISTLEKVYLLDIGQAYNDAMCVSFNRLHELTLAQSVKGDVFTVKDDMIYTSFDSIPFTLSYIPEWEYVDDLSTELDIPDTMITAVEQQAIASLARKFGLEIEQS